VQAPDVVSCKFFSNGVIDAGSTPPGGGFKVGRTPGGVPCVDTISIRSIGVEVVNEIEAFVTVPLAPLE